MQPNTLYWGRKIVVTYESGRVPPDFFASLPVEPLQIAELAAVDGMFLVSLGQLFSWQGVLLYAAVSRKVLVVERRFVFVIDLHGVVEEAAHVINHFRVRGSSRRGCIDLESSWCNVQCIESKGAIYSLHT
jgi:hypothetical protein